MVTKLSNRMILCFSYDIVYEKSWEIKIKVPKKSQKIKIYTAEVKVEQFNEAEGFVFGRHQIICIVISFNMCTIILVAIHFAHGVYDMFFTHNCCIIAKIIAMMIIVISVFWI